MKAELRKAELPRELRALQAFDRKIFAKADRFTGAFWRDCESWWLVIDGVKVGCCAFELNASRPETLYIATTGILPSRQRQGFGALLKAWQICYGRRHGFKRLVAHTRTSNKRMIALNKQFGFRVVRKIPNYYAEPAETAVVMELDFKV